MATSINSKKYLSALKKSVKSQQLIRDWVKTSSKSILTQQSNPNAIKWNKAYLPEKAQGPVTQTIVLKK